MTNEISRENILTLIQNSPLNDEQKKELQDLLSSAGDAPEFWETFTGMVTESIEREKSAMLEEFATIDETTEAINARVREKERALAKEMKAQLEKIDKWDFKAQEPVYAEFEKEMAKVIADAKKELDAYAAKELLK